MGLAAAREDVGGNWKKNCFVFNKIFIILKMFFPDVKWMETKVAGIVHISENRVPVDSSHQSMNVYRVMDHKSAFDLYRGSQIRTLEVLF